MPMSPRLLRPIASSLDPDAAVYLNAVAAADGEQLEPAVKKAINDFVVGCKQDGIWSSIKACCILAGARTLAGALVPLKGAAPTNNNFVSGDYNRETGLVGDGSTKYLDSGRDMPDDPQDDNHLSVYLSSAHSAVATAMYIGGSSHDIYRNSGDLIFRNKTGTPYTLVGDGASTGFLGHSRDDALSYDVRANGTDYNTGTVGFASSGAATDGIFVFRRSAGSALYTDARLAFYSIGESLDLEALDSRVSALITAIGAAI